MQIHRVGPRAGGPSMCLRGQTTEKDPRQESPLSACVGAAMEKDWPKRPPDGQLQEARKKTVIESTTAAEAVRVPAYLAPPRSVQAKQLHHLHASLSLGQNCHRQKLLHLCTRSCFRHVQLFENPWTVACQASPLLGGRGGSK